MGVDVRELKDTTIKSGDIVEYRGSYCIVAYDDHAYVYRLYLICLTSGNVVGGYINLEKLSEDCKLVCKNKNLNFKDIRIII